MDISISNYQIEAQVYESSNSLVYRAIRESDQCPVILKMLREAYPSPERIAWFKREYEVTRNVGLATVPVMYALHHQEHRWIIEMEDFGGDALNLLQIAGNLSLRDFLGLAINITAILGQIHQLRIIHKDICPANIVWNRATGQVKIIDFGISTVFAYENQTFRSPDTLEGTLAYIAPEQTGRMNRAIDYRADFYALGVTLYELLTGQLPFQADDPLELVHCHIAKQPIAPCDLTPVPPLLSGEGGRGVRWISAIIMKLLAKNAEDRYQSAYGLQADLEKCCAFLTTPSVPTEFTPGAEDMSDRFTIPQKLYGRDPETAELLRIFDEVANGATRLITVTGAPGVGKSALVQEVHKPITAKRGHFIAGKFDQYQRNIPFFAVTQAFNQFCDHLLQESAERLTTWKQNILEAVGQNGQVLIEVIPHLERLIGKQPDIPQVGPQESQNRFNVYFQYFIRAISQPEHPLVMFIDDLQWADVASLNLLQLLISDPQSRCLLMIGAYRDNEITSGHPLLNVLKDLPVQQIQLANLNQEHIQTLVQDCLHRDALHAVPLAELLSEKTLGNAFFVIRFLTGLYDDGLLQFSRASGWNWNIEQIRAQQITANVIEFMADRIQKLPDAVQEILKLASCLGSRFDLAALAHIAARSLLDATQQVVAGVKEGLLFPLDDAYKLVLVTGEAQPGGGVFRFVHDRVQQAAYTLMDETTRQTLHLNAGRHLLHSASPGELEDRIFDIIGHLNVSLDLIQTPAERLELARLNLRTGQKAKQSNAYEAAYQYFDTGLRLLPSDAWHAHYALTLDLHLGAMNTAYLSGKLERMDAFAQIIREEAQSLLDQVKVYEIKILADNAMHQPLEAVQTALAALNLLGIHFPEHPDGEAFMQALSQTQAALADKTVSELRHLPAMHDPEKLAAMQLLTNVGSSAYFAAPALFPHLMLTHVRLSAQYGNAPSSPIGYVMYGSILCSVLGEIDAGYRFGEMAAELVEQPHCREYKAMTLSVYGTHVLHWKQHFEQCAALQLAAHHSGLETGDLRYAIAAAHDYGFTALYIGKALAELDRELAFYSDVMQQLKQADSVHFHLHQVHHQVVANLLGQAENPVLLIGGKFDEHTMLPFLAQRNDRVSTFVVYLNKLLLAVLFGAYAQAAENAAHTEAHLDVATTLYHWPLFYFYDSLTQLATQPPNFAEKVAANQAKLKIRANHAPMNHLHKYYLVEAELARVNGKPGDAREYYDQAIALAKEHGYIHEQALANELAGKFYLSKNQPAIAVVYLTEAHYGYRLWGAAAKVAQMEARYAAFLQPAAPGERKPSTKKTARRETSPLPALDLASIIKASQAISGEIVLRDVLTRLMTVMLENAGAQKGLLLLAQERELYLEADTEADTHAVTLFAHLPVSAAADRLSPAIVNFVWRSRTPVALNEAANDGDFTADAYIAAARPKSVLCLPITGRGECVGVLYLENNLTTHGFPQERTEVLNILAAQAAISIENAQLYATLEQKVAERTAELRDANMELAAAKEKADAANQAKSVFLANMSHELRSPLNAILGFAQIMSRSQTLPPEHREHLSVISRSGDHLLMVINQILDLAKIEAGRLTLDVADVDVLRLLNDMRDLFCLRAEQKGLQLAFSLSPDVPRRIRTDTVKLRQVLINLLNNALKFTQRGSVTARVSRLNDGEADGRVTLRVDIEDTGPGIAPEELAQLFDPFVQTATGRQSREGTGLGLAISQKFAHLLGGGLTVQSRVGVGTTFAVTISCEVSQAVDPQSDAPLRRVATVEPGQPSSRILIVDDSADNRRVLTTLLHPLGFELREAANGQEAFELWQRWQPQLILMDMRMPVMDGYETVAAIRDAEFRIPVNDGTTAANAPSALPRVPIVALTASAFEEERAAVLAAGCDEFLRKPFRDHDIFELLAKHLGVRLRYEPAPLSVPVRLDSAALAALPADLQAGLRDAVNQADMDLAQAMIARIRPLNAPLADALAELVDKYRFDTLLTLLQN